SESWRDFFSDYRPAPVPAVAPVGPRPADGQGAVTAGQPIAPSGPVVPAPPAVPTAPPAAAVPPVAAVPIAAAAPAAPAAPVPAAPSPAQATASAAAQGQSPAASAAQPPAGSPPGGDVAVPLRGAASRIVANMEASLAVPTATSVRGVPALNATYVDEVDGKKGPGVVRHDHVGLGLAVDVEKSDGSRTLMVPCIKGADTLDF